MRKNNFCNSPDILTTQVMPDGFACGPIKAIAHCRSFRRLPASNFWQDLSHVAEVRLENDAFIYYSFRLNITMTMHGTEEDYQVPIGDDIGSGFAGKNDGSIPAPDLDIMVRLRSGLL